MSITVKAGGREFTFETYYDRGYSRHLCAYIKCHHSPQLPLKLQKKLDRLVEVGHVSDEYLILNWAFESVQENWWDWARELANDHGFGKIWSAGRSGGYLIFDVTDEYVETLAEECDICKNCEEPYAHHVADHCLFDVSTFEPEEKGSFQQLVDIEKFVKEIEESIASWVKKELNYEYKRLVQDAWDTWRAEVKRERKTEEAA